MDNMPGWFTDKKGNKINTDNDSSGISSSQMHEKGSDVVEETVHDKDTETEGMKGNRELLPITLDEVARMEYGKHNGYDTLNDEQKLFVQGMVEQNRKLNGMKGNRGTFEVHGVTLRIPDKYEVLLTSYLQEFVDTNDAPLEKLEKMESEGLLQDKVIKDKRTIYHISQKGIDALYEKGIMGKGFINNYRDVHVAR